MGKFAVAVAVSILAALANLGILSVTLSVKRELDARLLKESDRISAEHDETQRLLNLVLTQGKGVSEAIKSLNLDDDSSLESEPKID